MKKLSYLIIAIAILVMVVSVALAAPGGNKYVYLNTNVGICIMMDTGDGGLQFWWTFNNTWTFPAAAGYGWLDLNNDLIGTSGTKLHCVGKLVSSMTLDEAIKRGFDIMWTKPETGTEYYVKFNWME